MLVIRASRDVTSAGVVVIECFCGMINMIKTRL